MNCLKNFRKIKGSDLVLSVLIAVAVLAVVILGSMPASAQSTGNGTLTVNPDNNGTCEPSGTGFNDFDSPHFWDVFQDDTIHIDISPSFTICTEGNPNKINDKCTSVNDCNTTTGKCQQDSQQRGPARREI